MGRHALNREKWTITFDPSLKEQIQKEAQKLSIYPVQFLEIIVREKLNTFGFQDVRDSIAYINQIREDSTHTTDNEFIADLKKWQNL